eukprot:scaffold121972_cov33-Tisochrysis_lutea.AAC.1
MSLVRNLNMTFVPLLVGGGAPASRRNQPSYVRLAFILLMSATPSKRQGATSKQAPHCLPSISMHR